MKKYLILTIGCFLLTSCAAPNTNGSQSSENISETTDL